MGTNNTFMKSQIKVNDIVPDQPDQEVITVADCEASDKICELFEDTPHSVKGLKDNADLFIELFKELRDGPDEETRKLRDISELFDNGVKIEIENEKTSVTGSDDYEWGKTLEYHFTFRKKDSLSSIHRTIEKALEESDEN